MKAAAPNLYASVAEDGSTAVLEMAPDESKGEGLKIAVRPQISILEVAK